MSAIPRTFSLRALGRYALAARRRREPREPVVRDGDGGSDGSSLANMPESAAGLPRRCRACTIREKGAPGASRRRLFPKRVSSRAHPPAASQATQPAKLDAIAMASYDRTIFDFDLFGGHHPSRSSECSLVTCWVTCAIGSMRTQTRLLER
ncbi:hypothetical protein EDB83DRAFT_2322660 [Lactarius deliciosus]|nr:hypothetical protein EDB83DRAFT_2322660 [Lactarius deliciosus]